MLVSMRLQFFRYPVPHIGLRVRVPEEVHKVVAFVAFKRFCQVLTL